MADNLLPLLDAIRSHIERHGYPPSQREIAGYAHRASPNTGHNMLRKLVAAGLVEVQPAMPRTLRITSAGMAALTEEL